MTDIRKAAEERYPDEPDREFVGDGSQSDAREGFIAGAEWMREQAAREADSIGHHWSGAGATAAFEVAIAIRKIGENDD